MVYLYYYISIYLYLYLCVYLYISKKKKVYSTVCNNCTTSDIRRSQVWWYKRLRKKYNSITIVILTMMKFGEFSVKRYIVQYTL